MLTYDWLHIVLKCLLLRTNKQFLLSSQDGTELVVKHVLPGDSVHSLLSILDVITVRFLRAPSFILVTCATH